MIICLPLRPPVMTSSSRSLWCSSSSLPPSRSPSSSAASSWFPYEWKACAVQHCRCSPCPQILFWQYCKYNFCTIIWEFRALTDGLQPVPEPLLQVLRLLLLLLGHRLRSGQVGDGLATTGGSLHELGLLRLVALRVVSLQLFNYADRVPKKILLLPIKKYSHF